LGLPVKNIQKVTKIPNSYPEKMELLEEQEKIKELEIYQKTKKQNREEDPELIEEENDKIVVGSEENRQERHKVGKGDLKLELNTLITASDVVIEVLDARDPYSYRSRALENNVISQKKKLIFILNKTDLVARYVNDLKTSENAIKWGKVLRRDHPTIVYSAKENKEVVKTELVNLIKDMTKTNKKVSVSLIGYPNTGKGSIINNFSKITNINPSSLLQGLNEVSLKC
jgi:tRNA U34 5-carboxymethylaminomethyl modifying GTPase MnmE/TrmE